MAIRYFALGWSWTSSNSTIYRLPFAMISTGFQSREGSISRSPLWPDTAWSGLRRSIWWNWAIPAVGSAVSRQFTNFSGRKIVRCRNKMFLRCHAQYSICGKTRGVVSNVFLTKPVNENLGDWEAPEEGLNPPPPDKSSTGHAEAPC